MLMQTIVNSTEARKNMGQLIDTVLHERPAVLIRRRNEAVLALDYAKLPAVLAPFRFTVEHEEYEGRFYGSLEQIPDIVGDGDTLDALRADLAQHLLVYAQGYEEDFPTFFHAPNRKAHYPYVLHVLVQKDFAGVVNLIDA